MRKTLEHLMGVWQEERESASAPVSLTAGPECLTFAEAEAVVQAGGAPSEARLRHISSCPYCQRTLRQFEMVAPSQSPRHAQGLACRCTALCRQHLWATCSATLAVALAVTVCVTLPRPGSSRAAPTLVAIPMPESTPKGISTEPVWKQVTPVRVRLTRPDQTGATFEWDPVPSADEYVVVVSSQGADLKEHTVSPPATAFTLSTGQLKAGLRYRYFVKCRLRKLVKPPSKPRS